MNWFRERNNRIFDRCSLVFKLWQLEKCVCVVYTYTYKCVWYMAGLVVLIIKLYICIYGTYYFVMTNSRQKSQFKIKDKVMQEVKKSHMFTILLAEPGDR